MEWVRCEDSVPEFFAAIVHVWGKEIVPVLPDYFGQHQFLKGKPTLGRYVGNVHSGPKWKYAGTCIDLAGVTHWKAIDEQAPPGLPEASEQEADVNALIATEMMGYGTIMWPPGDYSHSGLVEWWTDNGNPTCRKDKWRPDRNRAQAWQVLDKMADAGWAYRIGVFPDPVRNWLCLDHSSWETGTSFSGQSKPIPALIVRVVSDIITKAKAEGKSVT